MKSAVGAELVREVRQRHPSLTPREAEYVANLENVDLAVGRLLDRLEALGLAEDTVVWFTSDNGPLAETSRGPLRGLKSHVWEGGHRVPAIVRWPSRIAPDSLYRLDEDSGQTRDLSGAHPEVFEPLRERLISLHREVVEEGEVWDISEDYGDDRPRRRWDSD